MCQLHRGKPPANTSLTTVTLHSCFIPCVCPCACVLLMLFWVQRAFSVCVCTCVCNSLSSCMTAQHILMSSLPCEKSLTRWNGEQKARFIFQSILPSIAQCWVLHTFGKVELTTWLMHSDTLSCCWQRRKIVKIKCSSIKHNDTQVSGLFAYNSPFFT